METNFTKVEIEREVAQELTLLKAQNSLLQKAVHIHMETIKRKNKEIENLKKGKTDFYEEFQAVSKQVGREQKVVMKHVINLLKTLKDTPCSDWDEIWDR